MGFVIDELIVMPPTYSFSERDGRGIVCDSSIGFVLPTDSQAPAHPLEPASRKGFWHFCPDFVIELQSTTDRPRLVREHPTRHSVTVYRPDKSMETQTDIESIAGEGPVSDFVLGLSKVWNPLGE